MWATSSCRCGIFWAVAMTNKQKSSRETKSNDREQLLNLQRKYRELIKLRHQVKTVEAKATKKGNGSGRRSLAGRTWAQGKKMSASLWSAEADERLRGLARSGFSLAEIAHQMQRSKSSVRARAIKLTIALARDRNSQQTRPASSELALKAKK